MAISLKSEADKAGKHPSRRFGQRERKLLETVAASIPFQVAKSGKSNFAGGSVTATITDTAVTAADVVIVQVQASTNAAHVVKSVPGTGSITVTLSADPGASTVLSYIVVRALA
jgi:hypothetical protein